MNHVLRRTKTKVAQTHNKELSVLITQDVLIRQKYVGGSTVLTEGEMC